MTTGSPSPLLSSQILDGYSKLLVISIFSQLLNSLYSLWIPQKTVPDLRRADAYQIRIKATGLFRKKKIVYT